MEEIQTEFQTTVDAVRNFRNDVIDSVPELTGARIIDGMTYIRFKNVKNANTQAHTDYNNLVHERQVVSEAEAPRVRTVWVPLHTLTRKESILTFTDKKRNRNSAFETGDVVVFALNVKHKATPQRSNNWRLSVDFRVVLPEEAGGKTNTNIYLEKPTRGGRTVFTKLPSRLKKAVVPNPKKNNSKH